MCLLCHGLLVKLMLLLCVSLATSSTSIAKRATRNAQAPGFLPVTCYDSNDFTSDFTAKSSVEGNCDAFLTAEAIPPQTISISNLYIPSGILQTKIENACGSAYQVNVDGCKLELYSIAYGCSENGRFYNGSVSYGCVHYTMQVFNNSSLLPRGVDVDLDKPLICDSPQDGNYTTTADDLADEILRGCGIYAGEIVPVGKTFDFWYAQDDGSVVQFKIHNAHAFDPLVGDKITCQKDLAFLASYCANPASGLFYHGHLRQGSTEMDIMVYPPGLSPLDIERRQAPQPVCLSYVNTVAKDIALDRKSRGCSELDGTVLDTNRSKISMWKVTGGDLQLKATNANTGSARVINGALCSSLVESIIDLCSAGTDRFGHGSVTVNDIHYEMEMLGNNGGVGRRS